MIRSLLRYFSDVPVPKVPDGSVIYVVGDIHGRADLLEQKIETIENDRNLRRFDTYQEIYLGDYVDRGPGSPRVLDLLIARTAIPGVVTLRGNHEHVMGGTFAQPELLERWRFMGGLETMMSYGLSYELAKGGSSTLQLHAKWLEAVPQAHKEFLEGLVYSISVGDYFFAHAGIRPGIALERQDPRDLMWIREIFLQSKRWHGLFVVHGHTPTEKPDFQHNRLGIDTGAYITGNLTVLKLFGTEKVIL